MEQLDKKLKEALILENKRLSEQNAELLKINTELRNRERELSISRKRIEESEDTFKRIADNAPVMIWMANSRGHRFWMNKLWREFTGHNRAEAQHYGWLDLIHPDDVGEIYEKYIHAIKERQTFEFFYRLKSKDGSYRYVQSFGQPTMYHNEKKPRFIGTIVDIHDQKMNLDRKDEFIGIASHELNTPLTTARLYIQLLMKMLSETKDPELFTYASHAYEAMLRMSTLIEDMTSVTEFTNKKMKFYKKNVHVDTFLEFVYEELQKIYSNRPLFLKKRADGFVRIDERRFKQVIENLVGNAVRYSDKDKPVYIQSNITNDTVRIEVRDRGMGIAAGEREKIFQSFYQPSTQRHKKQRGIGLGLHVVRQLVEAHDGRIELKTEEGRGSTFTVIIPKIH